MNAEPIVNPDQAGVQLAEPAARVADVAAHASAWLVGGVVRDALCARELLDIDIVVTGDPEPVARRWAKRFGGSPFALSDKFGCWRVTGGDVQVDICALRGGQISDDLALRDFTVNAIAVDVRSPATFIDPFHGIDDLRQHILRTVSARSFSDDPLRLVRCARIGQQFDLVVEPATLAAAQACAHRAGEPAGERVLAELRALLCSGEARRALQRLDATGALAVLLPELAACKGIEQSKFHHLDVFEHTLAVVDNAEDIATNIAFYLSGTEHLDDDARFLIMVSAVAHDLAKPITRTFAEDGRVRFIGHDRIGASVARDICSRLRTSRAVRDGVAKLVDTHLALGMLLHGPQDDRARYRFLRATQPYQREAIVLSLADRLATAGVADRRRWVRRHHHLARQLYRQAELERAQPQLTALLAGDEIAQLAKIQPGPQLGVLVRALAEEQAIGTITTRAEAERFVSSVDPATLDA